MVDQSYIQSKINFGYGKAATFLGAPYKQYRPTDPLNPLGNLLGTIMADFDIDPVFSHKAPAPFGKPLYYGLYDGTNVQVGDYLIASGDNRTFFVAGMEPNKPPLCVYCNRIIAINRPQPQPIGDGYYGGDIRRGGETPLMTGWPASALQGVRGEKGPANLPGDTRMPWANFLLPSFALVTIEQADLVSDDIGRTFTVSSSELTELGWRLTAILADT